MSTKIEIPQFPELEFEEQKHIYTLHGMELPSVTKIMQPLSSFIYSGVDARTLNAAADKGTIVHNACENFIKFGIVDISAGYSGYMDAFLKWHEENSPEILASETRLYHKVMRYAGTADKSYGTITVKAAPLTLWQYGQFKELIPLNGDDWYWLVTPWECRWLRSPYSHNTNRVWSVSSSGDCSGISASNSFGIRPALLLNSDLLVSLDDEVEEESCDEGDTCTCGKTVDLSGVCTKDLMAEIYRRLSTEEGENDDA